MDVYETHVMQDELLPFIVHTRCFKRPRPLEAFNWHENVELLYILEGEGTVECDDMRFEVSAGDVAVVNANRRHRVESQTDVRFGVLIIDRAFCLANGLDTNALDFDPLPADPVLARQMDAILAEYADKTKPFRAPMIRAEVLLLLTHLCRFHSRPTAGSDAPSRMLRSIHQAVGILRSEYPRDLSLDEIATRIGVSKYHLAREFHRVTGYTFVSYLHLVRCEQARRMLRGSDRSVSEIARECGFTGQAYFSRIFRATVGMSPCEYRKK